MTSLQIFNITVILSVICIPMGIFLYQNQKEIDTKLKKRPD